MAGQVVKESFEGLNILARASIQRLWAFSFFYSSTTLDDTSDDSKVLDLFRFTDGAIPCLESTHAMRVTSMTDADELLCLQLQVAYCSQSFSGESVLL